MQKIEIRLSMADMGDFVNTVSKYPFDMDLRSGRHVVDAKSVLGIFSLNLSHAVTLEIQEADRIPETQIEELLRDLKPFLAHE